MPDDVTLCLHGEMPGICELCAVYSPSPKHEDETQTAYALRLVREEAAAAERARTLTTILALTEAMPRNAYGEQNYLVVSAVHPGGDRPHDERGGVR